MIKLANEAEAVYAAQFETMRGAGATPRRTEAYRIFAARGLPTRRNESWHYTDLKTALALPAPLATGVLPQQEIPRAHDATRLVTLDGKFRPELSDLETLPAGLNVLSLRDALDSDDPAIDAALWLDNVHIEDAAIALNGAVVQDGVVITVAPGVNVLRPLEILTLVSGHKSQSVFTRSALIVGAGASVQIIETLGALDKEASSAQQLNHLQVLRLGKDAGVELLTHISGFSADTVCVFSIAPLLDARSRLDSNLLIEGGGLLRRQIHAVIDGEYAHAAFNGVTLARSRQHMDTTLLVDHRLPHGMSCERFRTILDEQATGVFQGKIIVGPGAQKTDATMQSKAILLSDGATMNNKPELEIFADDVKCGHGATCGRLDRDQLFYLMARGLARSEAESLLLEAFANETFEGMKNETLRDFVLTRIHAWLAERTTA
jgi:Fe-S cluster assembly protein SufD